MPEIKISITDYASANLDARISKLQVNAPPVALDQYTESILFLRAVGSRASQSLPAFYLLLGASLYFPESAVPYSTAVQAHSLRFSSASTISLCCRKIFDDSRSGMTGKRFANISDADLEKIAHYWANNSKKSKDDAANALGFLRDIFRQLSKPKKELLNRKSLLERRVGLLKTHADREAAHLSIEPFLFDIVDVAHVVASMALVGTIIHGFDNPPSSASYFDSLDQASWEAGKHIFPNITVPRLFNGFDMAQQASNCWRFGAKLGLHWLMDELPSAIGWWESH
jgi:hypothetical protein